MNGPRDLAEGMFKLGDEDLNTARMIFRGNGSPNHGCYHCQQAVERWLKGFLAFHKRPFPFIHDLEQLAVICEETKPGLGLPETGLEKLTDYATKVRYDYKFQPRRDDLERYLTMAGNIRQILVAALPEDCRPPAL